MDGLASSMAGAGSLLGSRPLRRLLAAQFSTITAMYALALAGVVLVEEQTQSSAQTGLVILASILPAFLGSLVSGAVVDRWGRVPVLRASHLARGLAALALWIGIPQFSLGWTLALVYAVNATLALLAQFAMPAELALLPDLAGQERLVTANTLYQFSMLLAEGAGALLLGPVVTRLAGIPIMGLLGALLCFLALGLVATLPRRPAAPAGTTWPGWQALAADLQTGWRTIAADRLLRLVVVQATLAAALLLVLLTLLPGLASRHLGLSVESAPLLVLPGGLGFALGAFLVNRWEARLGRQAWIASGLTLAGLSTGLLAVAAAGEGRLNLLLSQATILGLGLGLALIIIPARTVLEERPPDEMRGRVIAAQLALGNAVAAVPLLLGGALADVLGIRPVMGVLGVLALGAAAAGWRQVRRERGRDEP